MCIFDKTFYSLPLQLKRKVLGLIPSKNSVEYFYIRIIIKYIQENHEYWIKRCKKVLDHLEVKVRYSDGIYNEILVLGNLNFGLVELNKKTPITVWLAKLVDYGLKLNLNIISYIIRTQHHTKLLFSEGFLYECIKLVTNPIPYPQIQEDEDQMNSLNEILYRSPLFGHIDDFNINDIRLICNSILNTYYSEMRYGLEDWELFDAWYYLSQILTERTNPFESSPGTRHMRIIQNVAQIWENRNIKSSN